MRDSVGIGFTLGKTGVGLGQADHEGHVFNPTLGKEGGGDGAGQFFGGGGMVSSKALLDEDTNNSLILIQDSLINLSFSEQVKITFCFDCSKTSN